MDDRIYSRGAQYVDRKGSVGRSHGIENKLKKVSLSSILTIWHLPLDWRTVSQSEISTRSSPRMHGQPHQLQITGELITVSLPIYTILLKKGYKIDVMTKNVLSCIVPYGFKQLCKVHQHKVYLAFLM